MIYDISNDTGFVDTQAIDFISQQTPIYSDPISASLDNQREVQVGLVHQTRSFVSIDGQSTNTYAEVTRSGDFN